MNNQTETPHDVTASDNDLERIAELATLVAAAQDALTDDMVNRLAAAFSEGIMLLDRLTRNEGLMNLLLMLDRPEIQELMVGLSDGLIQMSREYATTPPSKGGLISMMRLASEPGTQEGLKSLSLLGKYMSESIRELHRHGGKKEVLSP